MLTIIINGQPRTLNLPAPPTLAAVLDHLTIKPDRVAVELNGLIIARTAWPETPIAEADRLEIVHFVGGGLLTGNA